MTQTGMSIAEVADRTGLTPEQQARQQQVVMQAARQLSQRLGARSETA